MPNIVLQYLKAVLYYYGDGVEAGVSSATDADSSDIFTLGSEIPNAPVKFPGERNRIFCWPGSFAASLTSVEGFSSFPDLVWLAIVLVTESIKFPSAFLLRGTD